MKKIPLTQGLFALVDDADYPELSKFNWYSHCGYAARMLPTGGDPRQIRLFMHFQITGHSPVDHIDGNKANNQRSNLRPATNGQNQRGFKRKRIGASSGYRGVGWHSRNKKWHSYIRVDGKQISLGYFVSEIDAARAYDIAALARDKNFYHLNFPI